MWHMPELTATSLAILSAAKRLQQLVSLPIFSALVRIYNKYLRYLDNGVSVNATVVDLCGGCTGLGDLDFSPDLFDQLAPESVGRLFGVTWEFTS